MALPLEAHQPSQASCSTLRSRTVQCSILARDAVCLLDVPAHKTGTAFTKPVDPLAGQAIQAWQAVRPSQPSMLDR